MYLTLNNKPWAANRVIFHPFGGSRVDGIVIPAGPVL
jgi:hypothetical protein